MGSAIKKIQKCVISGSLCGWGDVFILKFDLVVYVDTPTDIRIERLEKREYEVCTISEYHKVFNSGE